MKIKKDLIYPNPKHSDLVILKNVINHPKIKVGDYTVSRQVNFEDYIYGLDKTEHKLQIGKFTYFEKNVRIYMEHCNYPQSVSQYPFGELLNLDKQEEKLDFGDTVIGNDVFLGENVIVMPGVFIGDGVHVAANSVVREDIPAYYVAAGDPARIVKPRFNEDFRFFLLRLKWWNWDIKDIYTHLDALVSNDLSKIKKIKKGDLQND